MLNPTPTNPPFPATGRHLTSVLPRFIDPVSGRTPHSRRSYPTLLLLHVTPYFSFRQGFSPSFPRNRVLLCIVTLLLVADLYPPLSDSHLPALYFFRFLCVVDHARFLDALLANGTEVHPFWFPTRGLARDAWIPVWFPLWRRRASCQT